ncbi:MAG: hypothetical protein WEC75_13660 [Dehalococcoidia bacterium]
MYMQRVSIYPEPDKVPEVRTIVLERVKARQSSGLRVALSEMVAGTGAPQFTVSILWNDLAAFEAGRKSDQADADFQKFIGKLSGLIRKPSDFDILEVLAPMPS